MSGTIVPLTPPPARALTHPSSLPASALAWGQPQPPSQRTPPMVRVFAVLGRFRWLILGLTILGSAAGIVATRFVEPQYVAEGRVWIASESPLSRAGGASNPTQAAELVGAQAWVPLFQSGAVADEVVRELGLFVRPEHQRDSALFRGLGVADRFAPGDYELRVNGRNLELHFGGRLQERAVVGDSIGGGLGLRWRPDPALLTENRSVRFVVVQPREVSRALNRRLQPRLEANFLTLSLTGEDPALTARTLERWLERFVTVAGDLKQAKLQQAANTQVTNLRLAEEQLEQAALALQQFKVGAITEPTEGTAVAPGVAETQPTVLTTFFQQRQRLDDLRHVRQSLQRIMAESRSTGEISEANLFTLTTLTSGSGNVQIATLVNELNQLKAQRRAELRIWTDTAPRVVELAQQIERLQNVLIPNQVSALLAEFTQQERDLERRLASAERELREIPLRTTQEQALQRNVTVRAQLYSDLQSRAQAAQLAAESALPDVSVLDWPVTPLRPSKNTVPQILAMAFLGSLAVAVALALLLDKVDNRFRYPEQAKDDLGLDVLGAVPRLRTRQTEGEAAEEAMQVLETFRLIRLNVQQARETYGPLLLTISSPSASDGKSLVASNLAISFAVAGHRVLLIDGDIRRGSLHGAFGAPQQPGLSEVLTGSAATVEAIRPTQHRNLSLLPCGQRSRQAPELLASSAMPDLLAQLRAAYDVIIVDSPPLSAGIDAYALGMASGMMAIVLRAGHTNMRLAQAKLSTLDRMPVFLAGAVLNGIKAKGVYEYYSYDYGYAPDEREELSNEAEEPTLDGDEGREPQLTSGSAGEPTARA